ncbi:MAG: hypothetical protein LIO53_04745 [Oscillospiraceae bacterium]|nr:hypothetical protein [Oscillospiraceae bacterium]
MARTTIEIPIQDKNVDDMIAAIETVMGKYKFAAKVLNGENVWVKGDGVIAVMQCFGVGFTDNSLLMQGWLRDAIAGEKTLEGSIPLIKGKMRKILNEAAQAAQC